MLSNLEWFRTFKAIFETGTMSGAAKLLHISQPGIGLHLNALEAYCGYALFERTPRKMVPTERGSLLYQQVANSINQLEEIETRFRRKSGHDRPTLSVGMCVETFQQALERHIPGLDFNLIIQFGDSVKLVELLEAGSVDFILTASPKDLPNIEYQPFSVERLIVVAGRDTDVSGFERVDRSDKTAVSEWLKSQLWYNTAADMQLLNKFWKFNFGIHPDFVPNYIVPNKFSIIRCLSAGEGLAVLPEFLCREALQGANLIKLWEGYALHESELYFGKRKNTLLSEQIRRIEDVLTNEFASAIAE